MTTVVVRLSLVLALMALLSGCDKNVSLWERHCAACHDGKTVLNGKVVATKEQIIDKYKTLEEFANACSNSPVCMNIVKHEEKLLFAVGTELGIKRKN